MSFTPKSSVAPVCAIEEIYSRRGPARTLSFIAVRSETVYVSRGGTLTESVPVTVGFDDTPPELVSLAFSPASVDTSAAAQTITVTAGISDDLSRNGLDVGVPSQLSFRSPSGQRVNAILDDRSRESGTALDGVVSYAMTVPHLAQQGTWTIDGVLLVDQVGNTRSLGATQLAALGFPTSFTNGP